MTEAVLKAITSAHLKTLLRGIKNCESAKDEAVGNLRELIGDAVEKKFLDKKSFALFRSLERLDHARGAIVWEHLLHMLNISGLYGKWTAQEVLQLDTGDEEAVEATAAPDATPQRAGDRRRGRPRKDKTSPAPDYSDALDEQQGTLN